MKTTRLFSAFCYIAIITTGLAAFAHPAHADWYVSGAKYSCFSESGVFRLFPFDKSSSNPNPPIESNFTELPDGVSDVECRLENRMLKMQIDVTPPQARGMCMGIGAVDISSIVVDDVELLKNRLRFNWRCPSDTDDVLVSLAVSTEASKIELEKCTLPASQPNDVYTTPKCTIELFDVDAIAAANAKTDYYLADTETQKRESATRLPPDSDLSNVFPTKVPKGTNIPLCAHWSSHFLDSLGSAEKQRYGYIAGTKGEQVYIHQKNPQLCQNLDDDGCIEGAYVTPGDRVDVAFICGEWTQVQYRSRLRTQQPQKGWVETARIYGIFPPLTKPANQPPLPPLKRYMTEADPLFQAVTEGNIEKVRQLITGGANSNGIDNSGSPLADAIKTGDVNLVRTLINLGANVNAHPLDKIQRIHQYPIVTLGLKNREIFDILTQAGIDLNWRDPSNRTQLMVIANHQRLWEWERILKNSTYSNEPLSDPVLLTKRLLKAGADPNALDSYGNNALSYAINANNIDIAEVLLSFGIDPNVSIDLQKPSEAREKGSTPLMEAYSRYSLTNDPSMFLLILTHGADPNYRNKSKYNEERSNDHFFYYAGQTTLTRAAADGYYSLVRLLLENGADPTLPREDGALPEAIATQNKHTKIAKLISDYVHKAW